MHITSHRFNSREHEFAQWKLRIQRDKGVYSPSEKGDERDRKKEEIVHCFLLLKDLLKSHHSAM
jgi:hypothetical protein